MVLSSYILWVGEQLEFLFIAYTFVSLINIVTDSLFLVRQTRPLPFSPTPPARALLCYHRTPLPPACQYNLRLWHIAKKGHMAAGALIALAAAVYLAAPEIV